MLVPLLAMLLFAWTFVYRFNTLGGSFGGFENDHFVSFAYAKQVQAGVQPLRDFAGLGLQGAGPSLTYEASALAQRWMGNNLRSEALLTVTAMAVAAVLTFLAASALSSVGWAAVASLISVFIAPTLYNYTKVLSLAGAALVIVFHARRPRLGTVAAGAVVTAVAFLFRHDLAAYVGVGIFVVCLLVGPWRVRWRHAAAYVLIALLLLAPSLIYVQHYEGLVSYFRDGLVLSQREAERTELREWPPFTWPAAPEAPLSVESFFDRESNGMAWLFYVTWLLPVLAVLLTWRNDQDARERTPWPAVIAISAMTVFAARFLIRSNVAARLGDVGPLFAVLLAVVCHVATRPWRADTVWRRTARTLPVLLLLAGTVLSARSVGSIASQLRTAKLTGSWAGVVQHMRDVSRELRSQPEEAVRQAAADDPLALAQYLARCTAATDRVVLMAYRPEVLPFAGRLFGAGRLSILPGYVLDERHQRASIAWWGHESVPVALVEFEAFYDPANIVAPVMRDYLLQHYTPAGVVGEGSGHALHVFLRRDLTPQSSFGPARLPCLR